jgi:hypothetical protein
MNRRLLKKWALWLLPLLAARAFLPVGFMVSASDGGLRLTFCPAQVPAFVAGAAADEHAGHGTSGHPAGHNGTDHGANHSDIRVDVPCSFALAALGALVEPSVLEQSFLPLADEPIPDLPRLLSSAGPVRADRIRGPPQLS